MTDIIYFKETNEEGLVRQEYHFQNGSIIIRFTDSQGKTHRDNGPALEVKTNEEIHKEWKYHGMFHRVDGPAVIYENSDEEWYLFGKKHRVDGPAVTYDSGKIQRWINYGRKHRINGPATLYHNEKRYYINNNKYTKDMYFSILKIMRTFTNKIKKRLTKKLTEKYYQAGFNRDIAGIIASYNIYR